VSSKYRTYEFGCLPPLQGNETALEQMLRRHLLWNALVKIDRAHQAEVLRVIADPEHPGTWRKRARLSAEERAQLVELEVGRRASVKQAQAESGLYWCNYDDVVQQYERARKQSRHGVELRERRADGRGKVTVRFQTGLAMPLVYGDDSRLQIDRPDERAWSDARRGARRRLARSKARIRIGTVKRGAPIWLELPVVLHRPLPDDGVVRAASVERERVGGRWRWRLLVTVELREQAEARSGAAVVVELGWERSEAGLRVARWEDAGGERGELWLGPELLWRFEKLDVLKSERARAFHEIRALLGMQDEVRTPGQLVGLVREWERRGTAMGEALEWRRRHRHLKAWEEHLRDQTLRHRRELYRRFVAGLVAGHGTVVVRDTKPQVGRERVMACVSLLRRLLEEKGAAA
jgi:hypothetical protein